MSQTVKQAEAALAAAQADYLSELQRDAERGEGSGAQERRSTGFGNNRGP